MNIVIDVRPLMEGKLSGIEIYLLHLLRELFKKDKKNTYILYANAAKDVRPIIPNFEAENVSLIQTKIPNKILNMELWLFHRPRLDKLITKYFRKNPSQKPSTMKTDRLDIFFMPDLRPSALSKIVKKITVVHDLSFEHYKQFFSWKTRLWYKLMKPKREISTSDRIIAVSDATKKDLENTYKTDAEKITVIHEAVDDNFGTNDVENNFRHIRRRYGLPENYFLFLSTIEPRKNIKNLVRSFIIFKKNNHGDTTRLVIAGSKNPKIFSKVLHENHDDIVFTGFIDEEDKASVMKHADAFLYPSFFEGFGLPILEAMKCGTPVITSNVSSMPEIAGDAALLVDPESPEEIASAFERIKKPEVRTRLIQNMEHQLKKFSWKKCASETLEVFESVMKA